MDNIKLFIHVKTFINGVIYSKDNIKQEYDTIT